MIGWNPVTPEPLTKKFCDFRSGFQLLEKYPCQFYWQRGFLALAMAARLGWVRFDRSKLNPIAKAKKFFVSETRLRFCAIDSQISFLALAIASK